MTFVKSLHITILTVTSPLSPTPHTYTQTEHKMVDTEGTDFSSLPPIKGHKFFLGFPAIRQSFVIYLYGFSLSTDHESRRDRRDYCMMRVLFRYVVIGILVCWR